MSRLDEGLRFQRRLLRRDDYSCRYCGDTATDLHAVIPEILGGDPDSEANLVSACRRCVLVHRRLLDASILLIAARHREETARAYANAMLGADLEPRPTSPEIPGQIGIEEVLSDVL